MFFGRVSLDCWEYNVAYETNRNHHSPCFVPAQPPVHRAFSACEEARPSRTSKTAAANPNVKFQNDTNAALREITGELKTKLTQDDLKGIKDDLKKVEQKADETALELRIAMLVGAGIAVALGVFIYRLFSTIRLDSGETLSIT